MAGRRSEATVYSGHRVVNVMTATNPGDIVPYASNVQHSIFTIIHKQRVLLIIDLAPQEVLDNQ